MAKDKEIKTNAMRLLDRSHISYRVIQYDCDVFTDGMDISLKTGIEPARSFKTLVTEGKSGAYYVFVLPVNLELDLKAAARSAGEKSVEMIPVKDINKITGYVRGGCSPLGMKKQFATIVDSHALQYDEISVSGGRIGSAILIKPEDLIRVCGAKNAEIAVSD